MYMRADPRLGMIGISHISRLPMYNHLQICAGGKPLWPWRATMFQHNKRRKRGKFKRTMRGTALGVRKR